MSSKPIGVTLGWDDALDVVFAPTDDPGELHARADYCERRARGKDRDGDPGAAGRFRQLVRFYRGRAEEVSS